MADGTMISAEVIEKKSTMIPATELVNGATTDAWVQPPKGIYDTLRKLYAASGRLQACVAAYVANIETNGHRLDPRISLEDDSAYDLVAQAMYEQAIIDSDVDLDLEDDDGIPTDLPDPAAVGAMVQRVRQRMIRERLRVDTFLRSCGGDVTWTELRSRRRDDLEIYGCAYWEVVRDPDGQPLLDEDGVVVQLPRPQALAHVQPQTITASRPTAPVKVYQRVQTTLVGVELRPALRRFRRYKQAVEGSTEVIYFKALGDPRVVSASTGKEYASVEELATEEPKARPATELATWCLGEPPYGLPRWYSEFQTALGVRLAQETNVGLLSRGGVPAVAIVVTGGALSEDSAKVLRNWAERDLSKPGGQNKLLLLQIDSPEDKGKLTLERLNDRTEDGMYLNYMTQGNDGLSSVFRLPKILVGDASDINRATALAAMDIAESQVFGAERRAFDDWMTNFFATQFDVRYWEFASNPSQLSSAEQRATQINDAVKAGWLLPGEARAIGGPEVFDTQLADVDEVWVRQPLALTIAGLLPQDPDQPDDSVDVDETPEADEVGAAAKAAVARLRGG